MRRRTCAAAGTAIALLAAPAAALADYHGTDVFGNVAPDSGIGGLADKYPLSYFKLDIHVGDVVSSFGPIPTGVNSSNGAATFLHAIAGFLWVCLAFVDRTVIDLFAWAFSFDLLNGPRGALRPIAAQVGDFYDRMGGPVWLGAAVICLGVWGITKGVGKRQVSEAFTRIGISCLAVIVSLFFIARPDFVVGWVSGQTNAMSAAFLSSLDTSGSPRERVSDHLFQTLIYEPWMILNFGGLKHCVNANKTDADGFHPVVKPTDPARTDCRDNHRYATAYLNDPPDSKARNATYADIAKGQAPYDKTDSPAVDIQQAGGADQRLGTLVMIAFGEVGAIVILGYISFAIILAQMFALVLIAFTPVVMIAGVFPGHGHEIFKKWLSRLGLALVVKAFWSLVLAVLLFVNIALVGAAETMGWLVAFMLSSAFWWGAWFGRKWVLTGMVRRSEVRVVENRTSEYTHKATQAVASPVGYMAGRVQDHRRDREQPRQEPRTASTEAPPATAPAATPAPSQPAPAPASAEAPVASSNGRAPAPQPTSQPAQEAEPMAPVSSPTTNGKTTGEAFAEALGRSRPEPAPDEPVPPVVVHEPGSTQPMRSALTEQRQRVPPPQPASRPTPPVRSPEKPRVHDEQ